MAQQLVAGGISDCVLAVGFEKMKRGSLTGKVYKSCFIILLMQLLYFQNCALSGLRRSRQSDGSSRWRFSRERWY